jgi:hypothetical protein
MREVARRAGLVEKKDSNRLVLASESEAAALYCQQIDVRIYGNSEESSFKLKKLDKCLVIDAGDETIDITAYQVVDGLELRQLFVANGEDCGGNAVDREFKELLIKTFGEQLISECEKTGCFIGLIDQFIERNKFKKVKIN